MRKGLKPVPGSLRDDFSPEIVQKMDKIIGEIMTNNRLLGKKELSLIRYIEIFLEFRATRWEKRVKVIGKINNAVAEAIKAGYFTNEEITGINRALLKKEEEANFESFKKRLKEKRKKYKK